jgi:hypothetical protein
LGLPSVDLAHEPHASNDHRTTFQKHHRPDFFATVLWVRNPTRSSIFNYILNPL